MWRIRYHLAEVAFFQVIRRFLDIRRCHYEWGFWETMTHVSASGETPPTKKVCKHAVHTVRLTDSQEQMLHVHDTRLTSKGDVSTGLLEARIHWRMLDLESRYRVNLVRAARGVWGRLGETNLPIFALPDQS